MRNLKKTLVALLVVSMVIAGFTGVAGAAFSDTAGHKAANKIAKLAALGVLAGYPDGTFKPDNNITRAEFAKVACILAGLESSGDILKNSPSKFSDVPAGQWYTGWVNLAVSQGFMKGYPDGTFKPSANVTNAEVLTVICRILGYNDNLPGDWPVEYLVKAADEDISDGLTFDGNAPATRGNVSWFAEQALEVQKVEWDKDTEKFEGVTYTDDGDTFEETILHENFEGALTEDALCIGWEVSGDDQKITVYLGDGEGGFAGSAVQKIVAEDATINGAAHYSGLENKIIDFIVNEDDEIVYAEVKPYTAINDVEAELVSKTRFKINDKTYTVNGNAFVKVDLDPTDDDPAEFYDYEQDFNELADYDSVEKDYDNQLWDTDDGYQKIYALLNDDGDVAYIRTSETGTPLIVDTIGATNKKITAKDGALGDEADDLSDFNSDISDSDTTYIVFRNGAVADLKDIKSGDLLSIDVDAHGYDYVLTARDSKVTGEFEEYNYLRNSFTIGGKSYDGWRGDTDKYDEPDVAWDRDILVSTDGGEEFSPIDEVGEDDLDGMMGEDVIAMTDGNGYIRALISDSTAVENAQYGVVSEVFGSESSAGWSTDEIEIFTKDGELHKYDVDSDSDDLAKAKKDGSVVFFEDEDANKKAGLQDDGNANTGIGKYDAGVDYLINNAYTYGRPLVKFTLQDNGAIDSFEVITQGDDDKPLVDEDDLFKASGADDDPVTITISSAGELGFDEAVVFDVSNSDPDEWEVLDADDVVDWIMEDSDNDLSMSGYALDEGEVTYVASVTPSVSSALDYAMVMGKGYDADGPYIKILDAEGNTVKKPGEGDIDNNTSNDDDPAYWPGLGEGDVIEYSMAGGEITSWDYAPTGKWDDLDGDGDIDTNEITEDGVAETVYDVKSSGTKRIAIGDEDTYYYIDEDTLFWNYAGDDPKVISLSEVQDRDEVDFFAEGTLLKWLVVK